MHCHMDEMHIKEGIVYEKDSGRYNDIKDHKCIYYYNICNIIGFTNLGEVSSHLEQLDKSADSNNDSQLALANSMLVMMVKGLFSKLYFPLAQFSCTALSGDQVFKPFWEAESCLEFCGFKVIALTCDGLAANRRLF